ncbi:MAG: chorismate synthase [Oscillospiraceae bacterium]|nr:chorismate synthase [Oscillospiraceae bacterium]
MGCSYGENIRITVFGQSHSTAVGVTIDGIPAGERIDCDRLCAFLFRRSPGKGGLSSERKESDTPEFISGLVNGMTCGAPLTAIIQNEDARPGDYEELKNIPRPGHADLTAWIKYGEARDWRGGGYFSGRMTAPLCVAGGVCLQLLERKGIRIEARASKIAGAADPDDMERAIRAAKEEGDSVGGIVECVASGVPAGLGDPMFNGLENRISQIVFAIPAVKGIEFGEGFTAAGLRGSENNDEYLPGYNGIIFASNHCGGILGGISTGEPIVFRTAFKPTPSIGKKQRSVDLTTMEPVMLSVPGRHDACIVPRAVPVVEAAAAIAIYDSLLAIKLGK